MFVDDATPLAWRPVTLRPAPRRATTSSSTPAALGYVDLALTGPLHVIPYEGVGCTRKSIRSGAYPARRPLGDRHPRAPAAARSRRFLRWARTDRTARRVIATRYIPG